MTYTGTTADVIGLTSLPMQIRYNFLISACGLGLSISALLLGVTLLR